MNKLLRWINSSPLVFTLLIYCIAFIVIILIKPHFLFLHNGAIRKFGIGYQKKTILPLWLLSIILGIFSFMLTLYIINFY